MQQSNALLEEKNMEVVCQECGNEIAGISIAMKRTLKSFGQIVRSDQRKAFMLACKSCHANREIVLNEERKTVCKVCLEPVVVHQAFKLAMEASGVKMAKVDTSDTKKAAPKKKGAVKRTTAKRKTQKVQ